MAPLFSVKFLHAFSARFWSAFGAHFGPFFALFGSKNQLFPHPAGKHATSKSHCKNKVFLVILDPEGTQICKNESPEANFFAAGFWIAFFMLFRTKKHPKWNQKAHIFCYFFVLFPILVAFSEFLVFCGAPSSQNPPKTVIFAQNSSKIAFIIRIQS